MVEEEEDIREALGILFGTAPGERVMQPTFGCGLKKMVFETLNEATITEIRDLIERAVLFFEHRISVDQVDVVVADELAGRIDIVLDYTVRTTNARNNMVYPFYLHEGTSIRMGS